MTLHTASRENKQISTPQHKVHTIDFYFFWFAVRRENTFPYCHDPKIVEYLNAVDVLKSIGFPHSVVRHFVIPGEKPVEVRWLAGC